jgi:hypothetical protein
MTYPGIEGQQGVFWISKTGFQIRQSKAGGYPGYPDTQGVLDSMGSFAPTWGVEAAAITEMTRAGQDPHPIEQDNFELPDAEGGTKQFGVDPTAPSEFINKAGPGYTGE